MSVVKELPAAQEGGLNHSVSVTHLGTTLPLAHRAIFVYPSRRIPTIGAQTRGRETGMRNLLIVATLAATTALYGQQLNAPLASLNVNGPVLDPTIWGQGPLSTPVFTDSVINVNVRTLPNSPVLLLGGSTLAIGARTDFGFSIDVAALGAGGNYAPNILLDGFTQPQLGGATDPTGILTAGFTVAACAVIGVNCALPITFNSVAQALVPDPTTMPFGVTATAADVATFVNGYRPYALNGNTAAFHNFLGGFTFPFYGTTYNGCWISSNGYVSFGAVQQGFPNPTVLDMRTGPPRIASIYTDLEPQLGGANSRIFARHYELAGVRMLDIQHQNIPEFGNATGPHGGIIRLSENGDIAVIVTPQAPPTINTAVGITPGNNLDNGFPAAPGQTAFGRDLSVDVAAAPVTPGANRAAFELFDLGGGGITANPIDLIGFAPGVGVRFSIDPALPAANGYMIF